MHKLRVHDIRILAHGALLRIHAPHVATWLCRMLQFTIVRLYLTPNISY